MYGVDIATGERVIRAAKAIHNTHFAYLLTNPASAEVIRSYEQSEPRVAADFSRSWEGLTDDGRWAYISFAHAAFEEFQR